MCGGERSKICTPQVYALCLRYTDQPSLPCLRRATAIHLPTPLHLGPQTRTSAPSSSAPSPPPLLVPDLRPAGVGAAGCPPQRPRLPPQAAAGHVSQPGFHAVPLGRCLGAGGVLQPEGEGGGGMQADAAGGAEPVSQCGKVHGKCVSVFGEEELALCRFVSKCGKRGVREGARVVGI